MDRKLIRDALKKRGMMPPDEIDSILSGAGNVPPGYWDDAEVRGVSSPDEAEKLKAEIRANQLPADYWAGADVRGGPEPRWDGETDEEYAARTAPLEHSKPMTASGPSPHAIPAPDPSLEKFPGETDDEYMARVAPLDRSNKLWAPSGPSPKGDMIAMAPQFEASASEIAPIAQRVGDVMRDPVSRTVGAVPILGQAITGARAISAGLDANADRLAAQDPGRPGRSGADAPPPPTAMPPTAASPQARGSMGVGGLGSAERGIRDAYNANKTATGEAGADLDKAYKAEGDAAKAQAQAQIAKNAAIQSVRDDYDARVKQEQAKRAEAEARRQKILDDDMAKFKSMQDEIGQMKVEDKRSFGKRLGGAIAMALGAYGAALTGGRNTAADVVMQSVQDDLQSQREAIANKKEAAKGQYNLYQQNLQRFGDERQAMLATEHGLLDEAERKIKAMTDGNTDQEVLARADQSLAAIDQKRAAIKQDLANASLDKAVKVEGTLADISAKKQELALQGQKAKAAGEDGRIPGLVGTGISKQAANEAASMWGDGKAILDGFSQLRRFVLAPEGVGREVFPTDDAKRAEGMAETLRLELGKNLLKLGVLSKDDLDALNRIIPKDPTQLNQGAVRAKLDEAENYVRRKMTAYLFARGYAPTDARANLGEGAPVQ